MKKKLIVILSIGILAAVALVGCGSKKSKDSNKDSTTEVTTKINAETTTKNETKAETTEVTTSANGAKQDETTLGSNETTAASETKASVGADGYSDDELLKMAVDYYERHHGHRPGKSVVDTVKEDGTVVIHLFDDMDDHAATCAWYDINRKTATGKDTIFEEDVDLNN